MQISNKVEALIGFSIKAGKCIVGLNACEKYIEKRKPKLLVISELMSEKSKNKIIKKAEKIGAKIKIDVSENLFDKVFPQRDIKCFLITDSGFAEQITKCIDEITPKF